MVHFPGFARTRLYIQRAVSRVHRDGFPHSEIPGSKRACHSPGLIAACHVLLRLLAPRHPPYALSSLTIKLTQHVVFTRLTAGPPSVWINSPFHNLLYSSRTCGLNAAHIIGELCVSPVRGPHSNANARRALPADSIVKEHRPGCGLCLQPAKNNDCPGRPAPGGTFQTLNRK